jgi:hypothetical protein
MFVKSKEFEQFARAFRDNLRGQVEEQSGKSQILRNGKGTIQRRLLKDNPIVSRAAPPATDIETATSADLPSDG